MPLTTALVWIVLNNSGIVKLTQTGVPYPIYAFTGTLIWSIVTDSINSPIVNTNASRSILTKINFPKEALIVKGIYKLIFNSSIKVILLITLMIIFNIKFQISTMFFPFILFCGILFGTVIGLFLAPIGMLYRDISKLITFALRFLMYATPVVYTIPDKGLLRIIMEFNPLTAIIETSRDVLMGTPINYLSYFLLIIFCCIPFLLIGLAFYRFSMPIIVERLSA